MEHVGPTSNKKMDKKNKNLNVWSQTETVRENVRFFLFFFFSRFSLRYTEIEPSEFVEAKRKMLYSTRATRGNKKHRISQS